MKNLGFITLFIVMCGCSSDSKLFQYDNEFHDINSVPYQQDELTASVLPNIVSIDSLICIVAANSAQPEVHVSRQLFESCTTALLAGLKACTAPKGIKLILGRYLKYPNIVLSVKTENGQTLLNIGIMNSAVAGSGFNYYLIPNGQLYFIGNVKGIWVL